MKPRRRDGVESTNESVSEAGESSMVPESIVSRSRAQTMRGIPPDGRRKAETHSTSEAHRPPRFDIGGAL
jgi:hypothetical protein